VDIHITKKEFRKKIQSVHNSKIPSGKFFSHPISDTTISRVAVWVK
jgi:hypothetical protein